MIYATKDADGRAYFWETKPRIVALGGQIVWMHGTPRLATIQQYERIEEHLKDTHPALSCIEVDPVTLEALA